MKKVLFIFSFLFIFGSTFSQQRAFPTDDDARVYLQDRWFSNSSMGLRITFGYISVYNTFGLIVKNKNDAEFFYINVKFDSYGNYATVSGMSPEDGRDFGFNLYKGKLIVGEGQDGEAVFYQE